jgi:hypothetical protein
LLAKELRDIVSGRALWTMLLILCPLVGYGFFQAVALYGEASSAAREAPVLAAGLSPLDGVLVPTFGALYLVVTLLFPFVAIRSLGREKETGALRLLVQLPYRVPTLIAAKMTAIFGAWLAALVPAVSALVIWAALGGHLYVPETANLAFGHLLYGLLVGAIAVCGQHFQLGDGGDHRPCLHDRLLGPGFCLGRAARHARVGCALVADADAAHLRAGTCRSDSLGHCGRDLRICALSAVWLHPGVPLRMRFVRSLACVAVAAMVLASATRIRTSWTSPRIGATRFLPPISAR